MTASTSSHPDKSTTVRSVPLPVQALFAGLGALDAWAPSVVVRLGEELMFRTQRRPARPGEGALLATAHHFEVESPRGLVAAWSWGTGPLVVLVHGWNGRAGQLGALVDPLVRSGFQVVSFDAPGHGASPGERSSLLHFADALDAVIDAVRPPFGPLHAVVAHSLGGAAATLSASRAQRSPRGQVEGRALGAEPTRYALLAPPIDMRDFVGTFARRAHLSDATRARLSARIERSLAVSMDDLYTPALAADLASPALIVHDEEDREVPASCGRALAAAWPGAQFVGTRGLGHLRLLRDPAVLDRVVEFLRAPAAGVRAA